MKKRSSKNRADDDYEIPELADDFFEGAEMGRHYMKAMANSNVVRIARDLTKEFPNEVAVNQALREVMKFRQALSQITSHGKTKKRKKRKTA